MSRERLLGVFAHPDDESLVAGGALAACAAAGIDVALLCVTRGELGPIAEAGLATRETLAAVREAELRAAGRALGVSAVECLGYPDGGLQWCDGNALVADLGGALRRWRPSAVITFGPEGLYWHRDHLAVHAVTLAAVDAAAGEGFAPGVYYATWPRGWAGELVAAVAARGGAADLWGLHPDDFGAPAASITTALDVRPFLAAKLRALRSHRSQLGPGHLLRVIPDDLAEEFLGREYFVRARRGAAGGDWLAEVVTRPGPGPDQGPGREVSGGR
jgi:LmbE family N-acetylglucosaminyl deacetylase